MYYSVRGKCAACGKDRIVGIVPASDGGPEVIIDMRKGPCCVISERVAPDGGYGWLVSFMTFLVTFLLTGFLKSFSVRRAAVVGEFPNTTATEASWISGCMGTLSLMCSPFTTGLLARYGHGPMVAFGSITCALGFLISYFATSACYLIGSLGVCVGVGSSFVITASVGCTGKFFTTRKPTAMAIALSGGCLGAIAMPHVLDIIFGAVGLHYGFLVLSATFLLLSLSGLIFADPESHFALKDREVEEGEVKLEVETVSENSFWVSLFSSRAVALRYLRRPLFVTMAIVVYAFSMGSPHFLVQISGQAKKLGASVERINLLALLVQVADLLAPLFYGLLASRSPFRRTSEFAAALAICAMCSLFALFCNAYWQLAVLTFTGSFTGGVVNIAIPLVLSYNHGAKNMTNTLNLTRWFQGLSGVLYRFATPDIPAVADIPTLLIFNVAHLWVSMSLAVVMCFLPRDQEN